MPIAKFRFYAELNNLIPEKLRYHRTHIKFNKHQSIKHLVESLGVPHTQIGLILADGNPVDFSYKPAHGDSLSIYPAFLSINISGISLTQPAVNMPVAFALDSHLGTLARYLHMVGFDATYRNNWSDDDLADHAVQEQRVLLIRDCGLLKRSVFTFGYLLRSSDPKSQIVEIIRRFDLREKFQPYSRCLECNTPLENIEKQKIIDRLEPNTQLYYHTFKICRSCERIYWKGSHSKSMDTLLESLSNLGQITWLSCEN